MTSATRTPERTTATNSTAAQRSYAGVPEIVLRRPQVDDGARMWEIARDSHVLDVNSSYAYVLWCADHHRTSLVAEVDGRVAGFVTGYIRPDHPQALMIWQIAVDAEARGLGIAANMLDHLMTSVSGIGIVGLTNSSAGYGNSTVTEMHTTISPDNSASVALFTSLAQRREMTITRGDFLDAGLFPGDHEPEDLYILRPAS